MDLTKQNLLDPMSEIDGHPELGLNLAELSPLDLHDPVGFYGTALYGYFNSQSYLNEYSSNSCGNFDLTTDYNATLVNPNVVTPSLVSIPSDNSTSVAEEPTSTNAWQFKYPENERYLENEPASPVDSVFGDDVSHARTKRTRLPNFENNVNAEANIVTQQHLTDEAASNGKKVYPKPTCSYTYLTVLALKNSRTGALPVNEIYSFICEHFPYFRTASQRWKNSVRHNLSHNLSFEKIEATAADNTIKRKNLWTIDPAKIDKMDQKMQDSSRKYSLDIRQAMIHPEHLELLERGEMKFTDGDVSENPNSIYDKSSQNDYVDAHVAMLQYKSEWCEYQLVPTAKRQKTVTGMPQVDYFYEVATRRKTPLNYLTTDAVTETLLETDGVIDFSSHRF